MLKESLKKIRLIAETLPDDDPDKLDMMNTEGDYSGLTEWALRKCAEASAFEDACRVLSDTYKARAKSFENKAERMREILGWIMREANETKYQGVSGTVTIGKKKQGVIVFDESKIPDEFFKIERKLDKSKLNEAVLSGQAIEGAGLDNGGEVLTVRSK